MPYILAIYIQYHMSFRIISLVISLVVAYVPQRTPQRDRLFFAIDTPPVPSNPSGRLPPASSQMGVNMTAASDMDLNDFGSAGLSDEETAKRSMDITGLFTTGKSFAQFASKRSTTLAIVKDTLEYMSLVWLAVLVVGCYFFLKSALTEGSKKFRVTRRQLPISQVIQEKQKENMRIDREAYVYVDGG